MTSREPGPAELVVRVIGCALSARDLGPRACVPGGAVVGEVTRAGATASDLVGATVLVPPWLPCFECDVCRRGRGVVCPRGGELGIDRDGGFAGEVVVPARPVLPLAGALALPAAQPAWPLAALARHGGLAYATYARLGVGPGDTVVVRGLGGVGLLLCDILLSKGVSVVAVDDDPGARARVAGRVRRAAAPDEELTAAEVGALARVVDTTGAPAGIAAALAGLPPAGTLALVDAGRGEPVHLGGALAARDQTVMGIAGCHADLYPELCALALRGDLQLAPLTVAVPRASAAALIDAMRAGRSPAPIPILV